MYQNHASLGNGLLNELARSGEVNEEVRVANVLDRNPQLPDPASRNISWDGVRTDRYDVGDTPFR